MAPSRAYLFALDQPAISVPSTPTALAASTNSSPASRSAPTHVADSGIAASATMYGTSATAGASLKTLPVGGGRDDLLLLGELHPVGDQLGPAVEPAGVHRAEPALHVRHHLVLGLADDQRQDEEGHHHRHRPDHDVDHRAERRSPGQTSVVPSGHPRGPGGSGGAAAAAAGSCSQVSDPARRSPAASSARGPRPSTPPAPWPRPRLQRPGGQHEGLAQRGALEALGQQQRAQAEAGAVVEAVELDAEHLEGLALVPGHARPRPRSGWAPAGRRPARGCAAASGGRGRSSRRRAARRPPRRVAVRLVDRGQPVQEVHPENVAGVRGGLDPALARDVHAGRTGAVRGCGDALAGFAGPPPGRRPTRGRPGPWTRPRSPRVSVLAEGQGLRVMIPDHRGARVAGLGAAHRRRNETAGRGAALTARRARPEAV